MDFFNIGSRLKHAWNAFSKNKDPTYVYHGPGYSYRPDRVRFSSNTTRSIVTSAVFTRIAVDCSSIAVRHVRLDEDGRFLEEIDGPLNTCLSLEANIDQTGRAFFQDVVESLLDEGVVAIVPIETDDDPEDGLQGSFDIYSMRTGKIVEWFPQHIRVQLYNEQIGRKEEVTLPKAMIAIVENPLYSVMNEPNGTAQRLVRKLNLLDAIDEQASSGKLDLIIQLPYIIKTDARRKQADARRAEIERQLTGSKYGIAYTDGTERITQLNRPIENNLMSQVEYLTTMLYSQLGITQEILNGTASDATLNNYYNQTVEPILSAIVDEMKRKFLTKTARTQRQSILFFREPFRLLPVTSIAEIADKMTRNEIMSSNEVRQVIGLKPSSDPNADTLRNKNLNQSGSEAGAGSEQDSVVDDLLSTLEEQIDDILGESSSGEADEEPEEEESEGDSQ